VSKETKDKIYAYIRHHPIWSEVGTILVFILVFGFSSVLYANGVDNSPPSIADMATSLDFYAGAIFGSSIGYGFSERTSGVAKQRRIDELKEELKPFKEALSSGLIDKINGD
jgi:hypothetical protein